MCIQFVIFDPAHLPKISTQMNFCITYYIKSSLIRAHPAPCGMPNYLADIKRILSATPILVKNRPAKPPVFLSKLPIKHEKDMTGNEEKTSQTLDQIQRTILLLVNSGNYIEARRFIGIMLRHIFTGLLTDLFKIRKFSFLRSFFVNFGSFLNETLIPLKRLPVFQQLQIT